MSAQPAAAWEDVALAARGDLAALRRLRDHFFELATGNLVVPLAPKEDALAQVELLASMAANGGGEPDDWISLASVYRLRMECLERDLGASVEMLKQVDDSGNLAEHDRWTSTALDLAERVADYRLKANDILASILSADSVEGTAQVVVLMEAEADAGDERALPIIQSLIDAVTPERAQAIQAEVRRIEGATSR